MSSAATRRTFQLSDSDLSGFRRSYDLFFVDDLGTVIQLFRGELKGFLLQNNLFELAGRVDAMRMHCHLPREPFGQWLQVTKPGDIIYVCSHCP